mgnify:CR=1
MLNYISAAIGTREAYGSSGGSGSLSVNPTGTYPDCSRQKPLRDTGTDSKTGSRYWSSLPAIILVSTIAITPAVMVISPIIATVITTFVIMTAVMITTTSSSILPVRPAAS